MLVSLCDKLYNARAIVDDANDTSGPGDEVWQRFSADRQQVASYYRSLLDRTSRVLPARSVAHLTDGVDQLEALASR